MMPPQQTVNPGRAHARNGGETLVVGAGRDDLAVELGRRVEVVVVAVRPASKRASAWSCSSIPSVQQASMPSARTRGHLEHRSNCGPRGTSRPRGAHAEARRALLPGRARRGQRLINTQPARYGPRQSCNAQTAGSTRSPRAATALMLSRTDPLTFVCRVMDAMDALRFEDEIDEGSV